MSGDARKLTAVNFGDEGLCFQALALSPPHLPAGIFSPSKSRGEDGTPPAAHDLDSLVLGHMGTRKVWLSRKLTAVSFGVDGSFA
jgi:hypothetical protein